MLEEFWLEKLDGIPYCKLNLFQKPPNSVLLNLQDPARNLLQISLAVLLKESWLENSCYKFNDNNFYKIKRNPLRDPSKSVPKETGGKMAASQPAGFAGECAKFLRFTVCQRYTFLR